MESEQDFRVGFCFAVLLVQTMGFKTAAIYDQLRSVARGELTLMPSPEDAQRASEAEIGRPLTDAELAEFKACLPKNRPEQDARNREFAKLILRLMGQPT